MNPTTQDVSPLASARIIGFIPTRDAAKAKAFFRDVLGMRFVSEDQFATVFDANGTMLRIASVPPYTPHPFTILGWEVSGIEKVVAELQARGVQFEKYPWMPKEGPAVWTAPGGVAKVAWFKDPDGNILSVSEHT